MHFPDTLAMKGFYAVVVQGVLAASMAQAAWPGWAGAKDAGQQTLETLGGGIETLQQAPKGGLTPLGLIAVFSPVLLYGVFSIIRTTLNPRLKVDWLPSMHLLPLRPLLQLEPT